MLPPFILKLRKYLHCWRKRADLRHQASRVRGGRQRFLSNPSGRLVLFENLIGKHGTGDQGGTPSGKMPHRILAVVKVSSRVDFALALRYAAESTDLSTVCSKSVAVCSIFGSHGSLLTGYADARVCSASSPLE